MKIMMACVFVGIAIASLIDGIHQANEYQMNRESMLTSIEKVEKDTIYNLDQRSLDDFTRTEVINSFDHVMSIEDYIDSILIPIYEGGYVADDCGHPANFGINGGAYPDLDIENLTQEEAKEIYIRDYWEKNHLDSLESNRMALLIFDFYVNAGYNGNRQLQELLRDWGYNIDIDGGIGDETIRIINSFMARHGEERLLQEFSWKRRVYYRNLANSDRYGTSWLARVAHLNELLRIG